MVVVVVVGGGGCLWLVVVVVGGDWWWCVGAAAAMGKAFKTRGGVSVRSPLYQRDVTRVILHKLLISHVADPKALDLARVVAIPSLDLSRTHTRSGGFIPRLRIRSYV